MGASDSNGLAGSFTTTVSSKLDGELNIALALLTKSSLSGHPALTALATSGSKASLTVTRTSLARFAVAGVHLSLTHKSLGDLVRSSARQVDGFVPFNATVFEIV